MENGWIKIHRSLKEWQHYQEPTVLLVWLDLLLSANSKDGWFRGKRVRRGELFTSVARIAAATALDAKTVRRALDKLEESGEIQKTASSEGTKIIINQFNKYQCSGNNPQPTPQRIPQPTPQPTPQRPPYIQEYKEGKERKKINPPAPARAREEKIGFETFGVIANVFLKAAQHRTLVETFGEQPTANAIDELSCKLADGSFASDNHYATLHYWLSYSRNHARPTAATNPENEDEATRLKTLWDKTPEADKKEYLDAYGCFPWERITTKNAQQ